MLRTKLFIVGIFAFAISIASGALALAASSPNTRVDAAGPQAMVQNVASMGSSAATVEISAVVTASLASSHDANASLKMAYYISRQYKTSLGSVLRLRNSGWGYDEINRLYEFSKLSGKTPAVIRTMRDAGIAWGNIAAALNIKPEKLPTNLRAALSGADIVTGPLDAASSEDSKP